MPSECAVWCVLALSVCLVRRTFVSELSVRLDDGSVLLVRPGFFLDVRVEMVEPALSTLLAQPTHQVRRDERPYTHQRTRAHRHRDKRKFGQHSLAGSHVTTGG